VPAWARRCARIGEAFAGFDGDASTGKVADQAALLGGADERFVSGLGEFGMSELGEGLREAGFVRDLFAGGVTAEPAEGFVVVQFGDEVARVRAIEDASGQEGMG
jgi:hypothetical protein